MPALFANVPEGIVWGRVTAYVTAFVADGGTELPDGTPDAVPLEGSITLTPTVGVMVFPTLTPPQQAVIQSLECPVIGGMLYAPGTTPENVGDRDPGVILVASEQPLGLPDRVQYKVTWGLKGARVSPPPVTIDVPSQATVDLATVLPATPTPGTVIVVSVVDRERAEDAAAAAANSAGSAFDDAAIAQGARLGAEAARDAAAGSASNAASSATAAASSAASINWNGLSGKPAVIAAGATQAAARAAIGAISPDEAASAMRTYFTVRALTPAENLDDVRTPGMYSQNNLTYAITANNYPLAGVQGVLMVMPYASGYVIQRWFNAGTGKQFNRILNFAVANGPWTAL